MVLGFLRRKKIDTLNAATFSHIVTILLFNPYMEYTKKYLKKYVFMGFEEPEGLVYLFTDVGVLDKMSDDLYFLNLENKIVKNEIKNQEFIEDYMVEKMGIDDLSTMSS